MGRHVASAVVRAPARLGSRVGALVTSRLGTAPSPRAASAGAPPPRPSRAPSAARGRALCPRRRPSGSAGGAPADARLRSPGPGPASPPRREPLADLGEQREVPLGAVEPVLERALAVELAARDLPPHRVRRVHGQVGPRRDPLEAPASAARDVEVVVAPLAAAHAELDAG